MTYLINNHTFTSGGTWTPADLDSNLIHFYSAESSSNFTFSSGNLISQWNNLKPSATNHSVQATVDNQPQYDSTNKWVIGDGVNDILTTSYQTHNNAGRNTLIFVVNVPSVATYAPVCTITNQSTSRNGFNLYSSRVVEINNNTTLSGTRTTAYANASLSTGGLIVATALVQAGTGARTSDWDSVSSTEQLISVNGDMSLTVDGSDNTRLYNANTSALSILGNVSDGAYSTIPTHAVIYYQGLMSWANVQRCEGWAAHKFGYTSKLPSDHPYKSVTP